jgi:hypothetical protein
MFTAPPAHARVRSVRFGEGLCGSNSHELVTPDRPRVPVTRFLLTAAGVTDGNTLALGNPGQLEPG